MTTRLLKSKQVRLAIEGCGHGTLNAIYDSVSRACKVKEWDKVDLLIIGGDFQAVRNARDLRCMAVPAKYLEIGDFHEYYSGARKAPYLTIFVGGNHEASNYLWELYHGGWVAPNIYYLGAANVVRLGHLRIAGLSGIWKGYNYRKPHHERLPYSQSDIRSIYHIRELVVRKLLQIRTQVDVGISHDWPTGVEWHGDHGALFRRKDRFEAESEAGTLGNPAAKYVMDRLRPAYWFAAHLHIKFSATVNYDDPGDQKTDSISAPDKTLSESGKILKNDEEIDLDDDTEASPQALHQDVANQKINSDELELDLDDDETGASPLLRDKSGLDSTQRSKEEADEVPKSLREQLPASFSKAPPSRPTEVLESPPGITNKSTKFLALDKCLPKRNFLQLMEVEPISTPPKGSASPNIEGQLRLSYDEEWLAITRVFANDLQVGDPGVNRTPDKGETFYRPLIEREERWVEENIVSTGKLDIPQNFELTAPVYDPTTGLNDLEAPVEYNNQQTAQYCDLLGIENKFFATDEERAERMRNAPAEPDQSFRGGRGGGRGRGRGGGRGGGRGRSRGGGSRWR